MRHNDQDLVRYLTTSDVDDNWQISCVDVGHCTAAPDSSYPKNPGLHPPEYSKTLSQGRILSEYQLLFISEGLGHLTVQGTQYKIEAGTAFLLFPGISHSYSPDYKTGWTEYWVGFKGPYMDLLVKKGFFNSQNPVYPDCLDPKQIEEFRLLINDVQEELPGYRLVSASRIIMLLAQLIASERGRNQHQEAPKIVTQAKLLLEENLNEHEIDLISFSKKLGLSYQSFTSLFHEYTGLTPHQYYLNLKINRAKALLAVGKSVKEVAFMLGFESEFYFSRLFKKKTGTPPSKWRS